MIPISTHSRKPDVVQIQPATVSDMEAVATVLRDAFLEFKSLYTEAAYAETTPDPDTLVRRLAEGPMWVARLRGKIVGTISAVEKPNGIYVRSTAVLPSVRGNRIAKMRIGAKDSTPALSAHLQQLKASLCSLKRAERPFVFCRRPFVGERGSSITVTGVSFHSCLAQTAPARPLSLASGLANLQCFQSNCLYGGRNRLQVAV
jgi:hypothetical protein